MVNIAKLIYHICLCETKDANLAVICVGFYVELPLLALPLLLMLFLLLDSNMHPAAYTMIVCLILYVTVAKL